MKLWGNLEMVRKLMEDTVKAHKNKQNENERLRKTTHDHENRWKGGNPQPKMEDPQPFFREIIEEPVPPHFMIPKITHFLGSGELENHLKTFRAQMLISGVRFCPFQDVRWHVHCNRSPMVQQYSQRHHHIILCFCKNIWGAIRCQQDQISSNGGFVWHKATQSDPLKNYLNHFVRSRYGLNNPIRRWW